jgi:hypothetical protein
LPKPLLELIPKVVASIEGGDAESLKAIFDQASREGLFFNVPHWQTFLDGMRRAGDDKCLEMLWRLSESSRDRFRPDDLTAQFALAAAYFERPSLVAEIVADTKSRAAGNPLAYSNFWKGCRERFRGERGRPDEVYVRFAMLGLKLEDPWLLKESLTVPGYSEIFLPRDAWNQLATESIANPNIHMARVLWDATMPSRNFLSQYEFGLFAELAVVLADAEIFRSAFNVVDGRKMLLPREVWSRLLQVAIRNPDLSIARLLWDRCEPSREFLMTWDYSHFAILASHVKDPDLLEFVFDDWTPDTDTLLAGEHATWGTFLKAAEALSRSDLIMKMICRLEMHFDPIRHHSRGTLQETVIAIRSRINDPNLAREIGLMLRGDHWSVRQFLLALRAYPPREVGKKGGPFEGASRRIMKRLINSYVGRAPESFESTLNTVVKGLMDLRQNREAAFFSVISRGHENFAGNLQSSLREAYIDNLAFVEGLGDDEIAERIGEIGKALAKFEKAADDFENFSFDETKVPKGGDALIELITGRQEAYVAGTVRKEPEVWKEMKEAFDKIDHRAYGVSEWSAFFSSLIASVLSALAPIIRQQFKIAAHGVKNDFDRDFHMPLVSGKLSIDERRVLISQVRLFLGDTYSLLRKRPLGAELPFNLESAARRCFRSLFDRYGDGVFRAEDGAKWIAGREGIRGSVIEPMLDEIVENCRRAFDSLTNERRVFEVSLKAGTGRDTGFHILTVVNSRPVDQVAYSASSNLGLGAIQVLARSIKQDDRHGDARFDREAFHPETGEPIFRTTILVPAWEGELPNTEDHVGN